MKSDELSKFRFRINEHLAQIKIKTEELRTELLQAAEVQPTFLCNLMDHAKEEGDLNTRIEIHERYMVLRDQLVAALQRIQNGTYGKCAECSQEIDLRRLEVQPSAALCLSCQKDAESMPDLIQQPVAWLKDRIYAFDMGAAA